MQSYRDRRGADTAVPVQTRNPFLHQPRAASTDLAWSGQRVAYASPVSISSHLHSLRAQSSYTETEDSPQSSSSSTPTMNSSTLARFERFAQNSTASPTNPWTRVTVAEQSSPSASPVSSYMGDYPSPSPPSSPSGSPSPESQSRSITPTPLAPQPMKPMAIDSALLLPPDEIPKLYAPDSLNEITTPTLGIPYTVGFDDKLHVQFITPELWSQVIRRVPQICLRQQWQSSHLVYQWAIKHYRTACLLWMADDIAAWSKAWMMGLEDGNLPHTEDALAGIAKEPVRVANLQWKVAMKQLPRDGKHTEFGAKEVVPLESQSQHRANAADVEKKDTKRVDRVKFCDKSTPAVFIRKKLDFRHGGEKQAILSQIRKFHQISHPKLAKIVCTYARQSTLAILSAKVDANLLQFIESYAGSSEAEQFLSWSVDLASAIDYLHQVKMVHRSIRPDKILVDPTRRNISLAVFGIYARTAAATNFERNSTDQAYVHAAPETVESRELSYPADVFSFGCVLLELMSAAKGFEVEDITEYLSSESQDPSFQGNLDRVDSWINRLKRTRELVKLRFDRRSAALEHVLNAVTSILVVDPGSRPSMDRIYAYLVRGAVSQQGGSKSPRNSDHQSILDVNLSSPRKEEQSQFFGDLQSLDDYYAQAPAEGALPGSKEQVYGTQEVIYMDS